MKILKTVAVAFSMFSRIPVPIVPWEKETLRYSLCAFPLVGAVIGLVCWGWVALCGLLSIPGFLRAALLCGLPILLTGGIHMDGFCDTWDALSSHGDMKRKQEILKDPHIGSFAVIHLYLYFMLSFALWYVLPSYPPLVVLLSFCLSRSLSGLAVASFPLAKNTGLAYTFASAADNRRVTVFLTILSIGLVAAMGFLGEGLTGWLAAAAALLIFLFYRRMAVRQFGGISGDLAGWFLQTAELWMLIGLELAALLGGALP